MEATVVKNIRIDHNSILAFGGAYSNLDALKALKSFAVANNFSPQQIISTGDAIGYCAYPAESADFIADWGIHGIAGNVEIQLRSGAQDCGCDFSENSRCDLFAKQWFPFAQDQVAERQLKWMQKLPEILNVNWQGKKLSVIHGAADHTSEFIFKSTPWVKKMESFKKTKSDILIAGHCGLPFHDHLDGKYWINPGVIGMPANNGSTDVWFAVLSNSGNEIQVKFHQLPYNFQAAKAAMEKMKLTPAYAKTLETGIWDNCDILPVLETTQQGKKIEFNASVYEEMDQC